MNDGLIELEGRVVRHLEELRDQRASFDRVAARLGEDGFIAAWNRQGSPDQVDAKGSLERAYEQIINDLHGMLEDVEQEAHRQGVIPDPRLVLPGGAGADARRAWWSEADALGIDTTGANRSQAPGRWRRLAFYGFLDHELATSLIAWSDSRDLLQHAYAQRTAERGAEVWEIMHALRGRLREVIDAVLALQARLDVPPDAATGS